MEGVVREGSRSIGLHLLLIAVAVQGMTPDAHDLASSALVQLIGTEPGPRAKPPGPSSGLRFGPERLLPIHSSAPARENVQDDLPDEVCGPARPLAFASLLADLSRLALVWSEPRGPSLSSTPSPLSFPRDVALRGDDLIYTLCRLLC
jgi:hypothetical protein